MKRSHFCPFSLLVFFSLALATSQAATTISATRIYTEPGGGSFYVDGQLFTDSATFLWPAGSKHTLNVNAVQYPTLAKTRYAFTGWTDSTGQLSISAAQVVISADPAITSYKASMTVQHAVSLNFFKCSNPDPTTCGYPGTVLVNNTPYVVDTDVYLDAGTNVALRAVPNAGYVFTGWLSGLGNSSQAYLNSFVLNGPVVVYAQFLRAARVTLGTDPSGLHILADSTSVLTPAALDWGLGTTHTVAALTPQTDLHGKLWVFDSWSDAGDATHAYTMPAQATSLTLTAKYAAGARVTFLTSPAGLALSVDGRENWPGYNFVWVAGVQHTVSAPLTQTNSAGRAWSFRSWSNGGAAAQAITLTDAQVAAGIRLTADYDPISQTSIQSSPAGLHVLIDGADCVTPCTIQRPVGTSVRLSAPATADLPGGVHLTFAGWSDGATGDHTIVTTLAPESFIAKYQGLYGIVYSANPADAAAAWQFSPPSASGYYAHGTVVTVSVSAAHGYRFDHWEGDAAGASPAITVTVNGLLTIRAQFTGVDYSAIDHIANAAAATPDGAVAPGSIISIYGENLASQPAAGPESPLAQSLGGTTATVGDRILPLLFVSPGQVNALLPANLPLGDETLTLHFDDRPDIQADFKTERDAPGLFYQQISGKSYAVALHEDGSYVTAKSPARRGELVTLLGTGFGPYHPQPLEGFAVPPSPRYPLADHAELVYEDQTIQPEFAGAAAGRVGVTAIQFRIALPLPQGATIECKARVNGHESNAVLIPLE